MNVDNALKMMLVHSANDIAVALSETVGGSEARFVGQMNGAARSLGMSSTHYDNPNGLPSPGQLTTARDLAVLARAHPAADSPNIATISASRRSRRAGASSARRTRSSSVIRGTTGMKTGFICDSGFNTVVTATREGRTLIVVVLGADHAGGAGRARGEASQRRLHERLLRLPARRAGELPRRAVARARRQHA